jgi:RHS repeat-associated protein
VQDSYYGEIRQEYDGAHRLRRRFANGVVEEYEFDPADNLLRQPGLNEVTLQSGNRLKTVNGLSFSYNDRNHVCDRQTTNGLVRYIYDSSDQLVGVDTPHGQWSAEYDALGRRTRKTWSGETAEFFWNRDQLVAERYPTGRLRLYIYADALALTPLLFIDYDSVEASPESGRRYFIFSDQVGTPNFIEDEKGTDVWRARIGPFGKAEIASSATIEFNLRFPGHYFDPELSLHYNRFRYYDPTLGRYLQSDPWGIAGGTNVYAYRLNPLLEVDVRGRGEEENPACKEPDEDEEGTAKPTPSDDDLEEKKIVARANMQAAVDEAENRSGVKTVAVAGDPREDDERWYLSGTKQVDGFEDVDAHDTRAALDPDGSKGLFPPTPGCVDNGDPGSYNASHAEIKAAADHPGQPIGVSKPMCDNCQQAMSKIADIQQQPVVVADPNGTHVFYPGGGHDFEPHPPDE